MHIKFFTDTPPWITVLSDMVLIFTSFGVTYQFEGAMDVPK